MVILRNNNLNNDFHRRLFFERLCVSENYERHQFWICWNFEKRNNNWFDCILHGGLIHFYRIKSNCKQSTTIKDEILICECIKTLDLRRNCFSSIGKKREPLYNEKLLKWIDGNRLKNENAKCMEQIPFSKFEFERIIVNWTLMLFFIILTENPTMIIEMKYSNVKRMNLIISKVACVSLNWQIVLSQSLYFKVWNSNQ